MKTVLLVDSFDTVTVGVDFRVNEPKRHTLWSSTEKRFLVWTGVLIDGMLTDGATHRAIRVVGETKVPTVIVKRHYGKQKYDDKNVLLYYSNEQGYIAGSLNDSIITTQGGSCYEIVEGFVSISSR